MPILSLKTNCYNPMWLQKRRGGAAGVLTDLFDLPNSWANFLQPSLLLSESQSRSLTLFISRTVFLQLSSL